MANKLRMDLELDSKGYVQGAQEASHSTKDLNQETQDYIKSFGSLKKQLASAKKDAQNLAGAFASLSKAEQESEFGKEMASQLDEAIRKAAELQDAMGDVNEQIKNMASDTGDLDAFREVLDLAKSATVGLTGAMTELTGSEAEAAKLLKTLTTITAGYNAAIKITSILQANSKTMTALVNNGVISLTTATKIQTVATKALGAAMKALPYVAIAAGVISLTKSIYNYATAAESTEEKEKRLAAEEEKRQKKLNDIKQAQEAYTNTMNSTFGQLMTKYAQLGAEWKKLSSEHEKQQWIKNNKTELNNLGIAVNSVKDAEDAFDKNRSKIVESFKKRAEAAAIAARMTALYTKSLELESEYIDRYNSIKYKAGDKDRRSGHTLDENGETYNNGTAIYNKLSGAYELTAKGAAEANKQLTQTDSILVELNEDFKKNNTEINKFDDRLKNLSTPNINTKTTNTPTDKKDKVDVKVVPVVDESEVAKYEKELKEQLDKATEDFKIAKIHGDEAGAEAALEAYKAANDKLNELKIKLPIEADETKIKEKFDKIIEELSAPKPIKYDFSGLPDAMQDAAEEALDEIKTLQDGITELQSLLSQTKKPEMFEAISNAIDEDQQKLDNLIQKVDTYNKKSKKSKGLQQKLENDSEAAGYYADMLGGVSNAIGALGDSEEAQAAQFAFNTAATLANCVKTIAAMNAEAIAKGASSAFALPFPACLGAWATIIATITSIFASLPKFAEGGVVSGNSFSGDNILARVNSGERILTAKQNENLEKIANMNMISTPQLQTIKVEGVVRGKDILLVQKNYNSIGKKSGQNIYIN